ncbi:Fatty acid desaturase 4, chloroplastic [Sarracenia purpurea var. burkii]
MLQSLEWQKPLPRQFKGFPSASLIHLISKLLLFLHSCAVIVAATTTTAKLIKPKPYHPLIEPPRLVAAAPPPPMMLDDPCLQSRWSHRTWVATGCTTVAISLAKCVIAAVDSHMWLEPILAGLVGYLIADLGSGVYHWAIDNYGSAITSFFGSQVEGTVRHHRFPWRMAMSEFSSKLHVLGQGITLTVLPIVIAFNGPILHGFITVCSGCIMFSQQFHASAHGTKSHLPPLVVALQDAGVIL